MTAPKANTVVAAAVTKTRAVNTGRGIGEIKMRTTVIIVAGLRESAKARPPMSAYRSGVTTP